jgi:hypothetical protein
VTLIARLDFDYEDTDVHAHYSAFMQALEHDQPDEWLRVLAVLSDALRAYAGQLDDFRARREGVVHGQ